MSDTTACPARIHLLLILLAAALLPPPAIASAQGAPSQTEQGSGPQVVSPESEAAFIATTLKDEVPQSFEPSADNTGSILALAKDRVGQSGASIPDDTLFLIVDRSPAVQEMSVVYSGSNGSWQILGTTHVSTGKPGRKYHYKTPVGVFRNSADILGYRAQGTYNETMSAAWAYTGCGYGTSDGRKQMILMAGTSGRRSGWRCMPPIPFS
jgi:hypothetical protein